jgi:hypothetical protein
MRISYALCLFQQDRLSEKFKINWGNYPIPKSYARDLCPTWNEDKCPYINHPIFIY